MQKRRAPDQTATAVSMPKELYIAMEQGRQRLSLDRSGFVRMCISKELAQMGIYVTGEASHPQVRLVAEDGPVWGTTNIRGSKKKGDRK